MEPGEAAPSPAAEEKGRGEEDDDFGYRLFPDRNKKPQSFLVRSLFTFHNRCQLMLRMTLDTNPYAQLLLEAMKQSGCTVFNDRHFSCENCDGCVSGGFDSATSQIVLCQNNIRHQSHMNRVVTHELIHAFDHCRAHVDWFKNVKHLACSEQISLSSSLSQDLPLVLKISLSFSRSPSRSQDLSSAHSFKLWEYVRLEKRTGSIVILCSSLRLGGWT
ncbi:mitochondrial inner membrane protease ATP23 homolog isoform 2-T2 [Spheniscus humboldti]